MFHETPYDNMTLLDVQGLRCPLPVLKTKVALNRLAAGALLRVESTDPHSAVDFAAYCARSGHDLVEHSFDNDVFVFVIRKK